MHIKNNQKSSQKWYIKVKTMYSSTKANIYVYSESVTVLKPVTDQFSA